MKYLIALLLFLAPLTAYGADEQLRASIVQKLLNQFVVQVNLIDELKNDISQAQNPEQFYVFEASLYQQLAYTTSQLATLLAPVIQPTYTPPPIVGVPVVTPEPVIEPEPEPEPITQPEVLVIEEPTLELTETTFGENASHYTLKNISNDTINFSKAILSIWESSMYNSHDALSLEVYWGGSYMYKEEVARIIVKGITNEINAPIFGIPIQTTLDEGQSVKIRVEVNVVDKITPNNRYFIRLLEVE